MTTSDKASYIRCRVSGFTLVELMVTIAIVAVLASIAVPNMRTFILNNRLTSAANEMLRSIQTARSEAIKRQQFVVVCMSANPTAGGAATCSTTNVSGWIVFQDTDKDWDHSSTEELMETHVFDPSSVYLLADNSKRLSYGPTGFANGTGTVPATQTPSSSMVMCDSRGNTLVGGQSTARGVWITMPGTGRARITRNVAEISTLLGNINSSCPP